MRWLACALALARAQQPKPRKAPGGFAPQPSKNARARLVDTSPLDSRPAACRGGAETLLDQGADAVALVLRGESFRGMHLGLYVESEDYQSDVDTGALRRGLVCAPSAFDQQRAVSRSHVARLIEPLERRGVRVDVFLASYGCFGVDGVAADVAGRWWDELVGWYDGGDRRRVVYGTPHPRAPGQTQRTLVSAGVDAALRSRGRYRSVIVWRFDQVAPRVAFEWESIRRFRRT